MDIDPHTLWGAGPKLYTLPPSTPFLTELARTLKAVCAQPEDLADITVLVPTRRAGRALADAFADLGGVDMPAALLPMIRPIGDVDADDKPFEPGELADIAPPAISAARRRFELARLIIARETAVGRAMGPGAALALSEDLARLLDDLATEDAADLSRLDEAVRSHLPAHMQEAALFLDIILSLWPERLKELGAVDPAFRRSALLKALAEKWRTTPPPGPVVIAGSTGSIPAAADLMGVVARLDQGCVVLPGFDCDLDEASWSDLDESHPQFAMKGALARMGLTRHDVTLWPGVEEDQSAKARRHVLAEALRPAKATADWLHCVARLKADFGEDVFTQALDGLSLIEAATPGEEARIIALHLRQILDTPGARAIVVTPDRALARRVIVDMRRFGVDMDDTAGEALSDTPSGSYLMRLMDVALDPGSALAFAGLYASPLFALGEDRARLRPLFGAMERLSLRGRRPGRSFAALKAHILKAVVDKDEAPIWQEVLERFEAGLAPLMQLQGAHPASVWARGLVEAGEALAETARQSGAERLWAGSGGEVATLMREFIEESGALAPMSGADFQRSLIELARSRRVRPLFGQHPRLQIFGPMEARLAKADLVILAGLNEGVWPAKPKIDPFVSRGMRLAAGLLAPELRFGLAAHDFAEMAASPRVVMTRAQKVDGAPAVASRWIWRLQTLARGALGDAGAKAAFTPALQYGQLASAMDEPQRRVRLDPPSPCPPVSKRPRQLSVTQIETWVRDPYAIFARKILRLEKLEPLDREPGGAERGTALHDVLEGFLKSLPSGAALPLDSEAQLMARAEQALLKAGFDPNDLGYELPRFRRAMVWFLDFEAARRRQQTFPLALETKGRVSIEAPGGIFTLTARADRIDLRSDGALELLDYKTGGVPTAKEVAAGFAPQLPLEAIIAAQGGFSDVPSHESAGLLYVQLTGGRTPGVRKSATGKDDDVMEMSERVYALLKARIAHFDQADTPYKSQPRAKWINSWGDYDHLARRKEWGVTGEEGEGDEA